LLILVPFLGCTYPLLFFFNLVGVGEETLKIHSPHTYLHTNTNKDVTLFYIMYNHRGKAYYFYFKVFKGWEKGIVYLFCMTRVVSAVLGDLDK
jgi:hypothetical protein